MKGFADLAPRPGGPPQEPGEAQPGWMPLQGDVDMGSSASRSDTHESGSAGQTSQGSDSGESAKELCGCQSPDAFSLMMGKSGHNPSTSGCSSEQSAKADTHRELVKTLKELKVHLPADRKATGRVSTLAALKYALRSVRQVKASEEYYQLLLSSEPCPCSPDVPACTVEDMERAASAYIVKNGDMFAVAVAVTTGRVLYVSSQGASVLRCRSDALSNARFVELLAPHDVSVFLSCTTPGRLPPWSARPGVGSFTQECMQEKSFFCRVSIGRSPGTEARYQPFRMTPFLVRVCGPPGAQSQLGCLLLAERVHSGYEAPRIPPEKRIFTTTHTPNCLFQDVDDRAVPLLGYLPQDLRETPMLMQLHPSDRPLMLTIHRKILQSGGQPFDSSPLRFRAHNGEYVTLDTSWSSFTNPWSRRVSFIIGRHRVRVGPLNEDVFAAPRGAEETAPQPGVQELTEQIYRLLLQPVPHSGSSGYGSLGSNGSHEHLMSQTSSSDSTGHGRKDTRRRRPEMCKNGNKAKSKSHYSRESGEQKKKIVTEMLSSSPVQLTAALAAERDSGSASPSKAGFTEELACREQPACSYQQISCLDGVLRYLESCSEVAPLKRKCESPAPTPPLSSSDKRQATGGVGLRPAAAASLVPAALLQRPEAERRAEAGARFAPLALPGKAESVASLTSQCSYSSTIVHVGDKKPQPDLEAVDDLASGAESLDGREGPALGCSLGPTQEPFKKLGLTKEVLAAHTLKQEQGFLHQFKEIRKLDVFQSRCHYYLQERSKGHLSERTAPGGRNTFSIESSSWKKTGKNRKSKSKRARPSESFESSASGGPASPLAGPHATAWSPPAAPLPMPAFPERVPVAPVRADDLAVPWAPVMAFVVPGYPFAAAPPSLPPPFFPGTAPLAPEMPPAAQPGDRTSLLTPPCTSPWAERGPPPATPQSAGAAGRASPLFQSRGSSPLQLNLLQLEEAPDSGAGTAGTGDGKAGVSRGHRPQVPPLSQPADAHHSDALSTSSDLLDLLLNEDLCSAAGSALSGSGASAASDSVGSGSLGCDATRSGTGSSDTSRSSRYFGSIDSSENNQEARMSPALEESQRFLKCAVQDPSWLLMAEADGSVMMTYQLPSRNVETVLKEDREKLKLLQKFQPRFTESQKQELRDAHPWVRVGGLPAAVDVAECVYCENEKGSICELGEQDVPPRGLSEVTDAKEESRCPPSPRARELASSHPARPAGSTAQPAPREAEEAPRLLPRK
ncbi:period circadian protein homolog 2 [Tamandua tetradactyla]|uniref:period circadian protein homolog 2 n=1 Tax=Tamandua tetradactyla TaxID=48850 RepID=UPI00405448C8